MEKHGISKLNSNLAINKRNDLSNNCNIFQAFILNNFEHYANLVCFIYFNNLFSDVSILQVFA